MYYEDLSIGDRVVFANTYFSEEWDDVEYRRGDTYEVLDIDLWGDPDDEDDFSVLVEHESGHTEWIAAEWLMHDVQEEPIKEEDYEAWKE